MQINETKRNMRKTIAQLNQEAGEWVAYYFLKNSEQILKDGRTPCPLSKWDKDYARINAIPDFFYAQAAKANSRWFVSDKNWPKIHAIAMRQAAQTLHYLGAKDYPLTLAHFTIRRWRHEAIQGTGTEASNDL